MNTELLTENVRSIFGVISKASWSLCLVRALSLLAASLALSKALNMQVLITI